MYKHIDKHVLSHKGDTPELVKRREGLLMGQLHYRAMVFHVAHADGLTTHTHTGRRGLDAARICSEASLSSVNPN